VTLAVSILQGPTGRNHVVAELRSRDLSITLSDYVCCLSCCVFWCFRQRRDSVDTTTTFAVIMTNKGHDQQQTMPADILFVWDECRVVPLFDCCVSCVSCCIFGCFRQCRDSMCIINNYAEQSAFSCIESEYEVDSLVSQISKRKIDGAV
jgi:hypothetical protein